MPSERPAFGTAPHRQPQIGIALQHSGRRMTIAIEVARLHHHPARLHRLQKQQIRRGIAAVVRCQQHRAGQLRRAQVLP